MVWLGKGIVRGLGSSGGFGTESLAFGPAELFAVGAVAAFNGAVGIPFGRVWPTLPIRPGGRVWPAFNVRGGGRSGLRSPGHNMPFYRDPSDPQLPSETPVRPTQFPKCLHRLSFCHLELIRRSRPSAHHGQGQSLPRITNSSRWPSLNPPGPGLVRPPGDQHLQRWACSVRIPNDDCIR